MADALGNEPFGPTAFATGTTAAWQASEMIPADKQLVFVRDGSTITQRLGDGVTPALQLPLIGGAGGGTVSVDAKKVDVSSTGDNGELIASTPIATSNPTKSVAFSIELDTVQAGDVIQVLGDMQATNPYTYNALFSTQIILATSAADTAGLEITEASGSNITPAMHHMQVARVGTLVAPVTPRRFVNFVVWSAASLAQPGDALVIDQDYGKLSVIRYRQQATFLPNGFIQGPAGQDGASGATTIDGLTDVSPTGKSVAKAADAAAIRTLIAALGRDEVLADPVVLESSASSTSGVWAFMRTGGKAAGDNPLTQYLSRIAAGLWSQKSVYTDAFDRIQIGAGKVTMGNGTVAPAVSLAASATAFLVTGNVNPAADATNDLGAGGTARWRNAYFSGGVAKAIRAVSGTGNIGSTDSTVIAVPPASTTITMTLPSAVSFPGREFRVRNAGPGSLTIAASAGTVERTSVPLGEVVEYQSDGTNWRASATGLSDALRVKATNAQQMQGPTWPQLAARTTPYFCQHRTGGSGPTVVGGNSTACHVPGSRGAAKAALAAGMSFLDGDISIDAGGSAWVMHDKSNLELSTELTGPVAKTPSSVMAGGYILASKTSGGRYRDQPIMSAREFIVEFADKAPILLEPKDQLTGTEWQRTVDILKPIIAGYEDRVIFTISATNVVGNAPYAFAQGLPWGFYHQSGNVEDATIRAAAIANGCKQVMVTTGVTQATVDAYKAGGVHVIGYGSSRRPSVAAYTGKAVYGIMDEHANHLGQLGGAPGISMAPQGFHDWIVPATSQERPKLQADGSGYLFDAPDGAGRQWALNSSFVLGATFTLDVHCTLASPVTNNGNWFGLNICNPSDASLSDNLLSDPGGYFIQFFPNSTTNALRIATREANTFAMKAQQDNVAAVPAYGDYYLRVVVNGTEVRLSRRDAYKGALLGTEAVYANQQWRGPFLHLGGPIGTGFTVLFAEGELS